MTTLLVEVANTFVETQVYLKRLFDSHTPSGKIITPKMILSCKTGRIKGRRLVVLNPITLD